MTPQQVRITAIAASTAALSLVAVLARCASRQEVRRRSDYAILASCISNFAMIGLVLGMVRHGMGLHDAEVSPRGHIVVSVLLWIMPVLHVCCLGLTKIGSLLLYNSIFPNASLHRCTRALITLVALW